MDRLPCGKRNSIVSRIKNASSSNKTRGFSSCSKTHCPKPQAPKRRIPTHKQRAAAKHQLLLSEHLHPNPQIAPPPLCGRGRQQLPRPCPYPWRILRGWGGVMMCAIMHVHRPQQNLKSLAQALHPPLLNRLLMLGCANSCKNCRLKKQPLRKSCRYRPHGRAEHPLWDLPVQTQCSRTSCALSCKARIAKLDTMRSAAMMHSARWRRLERR